MKKKKYNLKEVGVKSPEEFISSRIPHTHCVRKLLVLLLLLLLLLCNGSS
jgi:hypothetical protein